MKEIFFFCLLLFSMPVFAQEKKYWQQEVDYTIRVKLDDVNNFLRGNIEIEYTNNSPDTLHYIMMHLWANAYKNNYTAFAKQKLQNGSTDFYYSGENDRGFIDSLNFVVMGLKATTEIDSANIDIAKINLPIPLYPDKKIVITTPFRIKIPKTFSRMGHIGQQYQISQWYPKPAVYDRYGWHAMPYLDQGEFYSEFGKFDVEITLPKNYVVAATGVLQNKIEEEWLNKKSQATIDKLSSPIYVNKSERDSFPPSLPETKTLHYLAEQVHDFAWFADKKYNVVKGSVELPYSKKEVTTWVMFTDDQANVWRNAIHYVDSSIYYYSKWVGEYPYPQATAVYGALEAGGGMEYPMITVISGSSRTKDLEGVIAHEVGHNWFYGILAFNEREHPWMDEGINSFYENRYVETRYPDEGFFADIIPSIVKTLELDYPHHYGNYLFYSFCAAPHNDQPMDINANQFTTTNYGSIVYAKTPEIFLYLQNFLGKEIYDSIMHEFFEEWKFKHPYPEDIKTFFEMKTKKELDWFFNQLIETTDHLDYKLKKEDVSLQIGNSTYDQLIVKNNGEVKGPYSIAAFKDKNKVREIWYGGFNGKMKVTFPDGDYDYFKIDPDYSLPEINRKNNFLKTRGVLKTMEPIRFQWLASIDNPNRTQLFFTPLAGWNYYDGLTPGIALYNSVIVPHKINFILLPQIGLHSGKFVGLGAVNVPFYL
ncbi:MAG: M1 family metallopeptidase, partial [Chitinophagales bacterium]|nr:M1 family metallopeptidase [Chitinophagales bacterium]